MLKENNCYTELVEMQSSSDIMEMSLEVHLGSLTIEPPCNSLMPLLASNGKTMFIKLFIISELGNQYRSTGLKNR